MFRLLYVLSLLLLTLSPSLGQSGTKQRSRHPLMVGWHDEMNDPAAWKPLAMENQPDIYASHPGVLTLRLPHVPQGFPYAFQWSGVTRTISADLGRYPVLMAYVSSLDPGSYAHLDIEERDYSGHVAHVWRSPTLTHPGLTFIDMGKKMGPHVWRLTLRLIVGGKLTGAKCEYNWVRFVRREDVPYLQEVPTLQRIMSGEPTGDAPGLSASPSGASSGLHTTNMRSAP